MTDITIPPEAVEAAWAAFRQHGVGPDLIRAALNAWPGMKTEAREVLNFGNNIDGPLVSAERVPFLILPLPQEARDE